MFSRLAPSIRADMTIKVRILPRKITRPPKCANFIPLSLVVLLVVNTANE
jgi:hypothetical protein